MLHAVESTPDKGLNRHRERQMSSRFEAEACCFINDCSQNLIVLARMLGVRELRVYYRNQSDPPLIRR